MNNMTAKLYLEMLMELRRQLDEADSIFVEMSEIVVVAMTEERFSATQKKELLALDKKYQAILQDVLDGVMKLYPGKMKILPVENNDDLIRSMEGRNAQFEELERIVEQLLKPYDSIERTQKIKPNNHWRLIMENIDFKGQFSKLLEGLELGDKRPNILVAGYTGCGKTALIRTILGDAVPPEAVKNGKPQILDFDKYERDSIVLWDSRGLELGDAEADFCEHMREFIAERRDDVNIDEHIHLVWYLIQGSGARVTESDLKLIKNIFTSDNVIVGVSKADITSDKQMTAIRKVLANAEIPDDRIIAVSDAEGGATGCDELVKLSRIMLPEAYRDAFMAAQSIDREARVETVTHKLERAREFINASIKNAEKLAETPIPVADGGLLAPVEIKLLASLAALYGLRDKIVRGDAERFAADMVTAFVESLGKLDADAEGNVISTSMAATLTGALGHYARNNFEAYAIARAKGTPLPGLGFDLELFKQFYANYKQGEKMKPNILVCGKTGVGKTSLIQAVTHHGVVPDSAIGDAQATTEGFDLYKTEIANFIDSEGMNPGTQSVDDYADFILDEVLERLDSDEAENLIHTIWYCIDGSGGRIQNADAKLIQTFSDKVLLVVTKSELMRKGQIEEMMNSLCELIARDHIVMVSASNRTGLKQLVSQTESMSESAMNNAEEELESFRDRWNDYYHDMKSSWQAGNAAEADEYINWAAGRAAAIAMIPLPLADVAPLIANEVYMIYRLAEVYGMAITETVVTMLLGCAGGSIVGKIGASFLPILKIPIAAGVTYGVGKAAQAYFESDMTMTMAELKARFLAGEREAKKREWKPVRED